MFDNSSINEKINQRNIKINSKNVMPEDQDSEYYFFIC